MATSVAMALRLLGALSGHRVNASSEKTTGAAPEVRNR